jgi:hypothetical protein
MPTSLQEQRVLILTDFRERQQSIRVKDAVSLQDLQINVDLHRDLVHGNLR